MFKCHLFTTVIIMKLTVDAFYPPVSEVVKTVTTPRAVIAAQNLREEVIFNTENFVRYSPFINQLAERHELDPALVKAVIVVESKFNPKAGSHKGALGLMQLMPLTAREVGVNDRMNPYQNISGGVKYLKKMLKRFDSVPLALAAYNAGPGKVLKYKGIPPYKETQGYVRKVLAARDVLKFS